MRMRRKKNVSVRLASCKDLYIEPLCDDMNFLAQDDTNYIDVQSIFNNENPVVLEIGSGRGRFARKFAEMNPQKNIIAIEKIDNVLVEACESIEGLNLGNLKFMKVEAAYLARFLKQNTVSEIYLNFSTPFQKKSYAQHRLTSKRFLDIYRQFCIPEAVIYQKTDNMQLFEFSIEQFSTNGFELRKVSLDLHSSDIKNDIITEYEEKFVAEEKPIYYLEAVLKKRP